MERVAGLDAAYLEKGVGIGAAVVLRWPTLELLEERWAVGRVSFPYIPGLLSFREVPLLLKAFGELKRRVEVIFVDGQGIAHPRGLGLASHIGIILDLPTIGCAKKPLVGEGRSPGYEKGASSPLLYRGRRVGVILRTKRGVKPIYVSPGHRIDIKASQQLVISACTRYRLPEPTRKAHLLAQRAKRELSSRSRAEAPPP